LWFFAVPVIAAIGLTLFIFVDVSKISKFAPFYFGAEFALLWLAVYLPAWRAYSMRKCFKQIFPPGRTDRSSSIDIDDDRIISTIPGVSEGRFFWNAILAFAQDEKVTLLYIRKNAFLFIPTCVMSRAQRVELNDLVARNMQRRPK
ncbi:MAG: YcxB family protein, partial [Terracidiphilus sp.]